MNILKLSILGLNVLAMAQLTACGDNENREGEGMGFPTDPNDQSILEPQTQVNNTPTMPDSASARNSFLEESNLFPPEYIRDGVEITPLALAELEPTEGYETTGLVSFIQTEDGGMVRIIARLTDISSGLHGFHIHENGDCSAADASSAGDHFNPENQMHGGRSSEERHMGDLGNIEANANNLASVDIYDRNLTFEGSNSIIGKAVVVHSGEDDLTSQPAGDAGDRIACGIIELHHIANQP